MLSYIFIPQIRAAHLSVEYLSEVNKTVKELLNVHAQNTILQEEIKNVVLIKANAEEAHKENARLTEALNLEPLKEWKGVWAKIAYRDPSKWTTITIDKGLINGVTLKSAVIGFDGKNLGLAGTVIEEGENTSKILLINDEEFAAAVYLEKSGAAGLLKGASGNYLKLKYISLNTEVQEGEEVISYRSSMIFPAGIKTGRVVSVEKGDDFKTSQTLNIMPYVKPSEIKEVFVITGNK